MKNTALGKFIFIVGTALLLGGCSGMVIPPYATHGTSVGIIAPAGGYSEWHTDSRNHTTGDSHSQSQGNCTQSEDSQLSENSLTRTHQSNCNTRSQTHSSSTSKTRSSSVGFSVGGPVGASIGLIKQMESMNRAPANDMSSNEMFKNFGF
ncbi:hypothetical protein AAD29_03040 [Salmonella enterica subsp. enterica serovar Enteritidis]|uniref:Lipoprotein n=1 Tax=Salmonella enteritidis TaxID=149539 RepID=A0A5X3STS3_SALEN|nr:hypothetical protein [Salmonella enterica]EAB5616058.1 hypothetical protein [Salmonella enterica subsp. enterica serovar Enteritidis]EBH3434821.1 hypothetical protein [Salmonella enterica subsp. enterica serovar Enteritidis]EBI8136905.1 hypothetical protein [Salmonella enterica]EBK1987856.1 hypothetical protein [Salmonella enterica subsp. enterica serovar Enteritidis]EBK2052679.1 hypothetical protein [Salmonella enterica subsp. enterica serovar Enteritidis]